MMDLTQSFDDRRSVILEMARLMNVILIEMRRCCRRRRSSSHGRGGGGGGWGSLSVGVSKGKLEFAPTATIGTGFFLR